MIICPVARRVSPWNRPTACGLRGAQSEGVDVDEEIMGGDGTVPLLFFFRDHDSNQLMIVEGQ